MVYLVQTFERDLYVRKVGGGVGRDEPQRDAFAGGEVEIVVVETAVDMRHSLQHHVV